jgi:transcriptional regulator with XRE-family HTH domain
MSRRDALVARRRALGMTQEALAEALTAHRTDGREEQVATSTVSGWERGTTAPGPEWMRPLAKVLQVDLDDLPQYLAATDAEQEAPGLDGDAAPTVTAMWAMLDGFRSADRQVGGGMLYTTLTHYLRQEIAPYLVDPAGLQAEAHLFAVAASFTESAGWMAYDGGQEQAARQHFNRAYRLATAAGDGELIANVCASMAYLAAQLGWATDAVRLAGAGLDRTRPGAGRLTARLHAMQAHGLALQGRQDLCTVALQDAEVALATDIDEPLPDWITPFDEASLASESATCLRKLGDLTAAEQSARQAIALRDKSRARSHAFAQILLAQILVDADRVDEAAALGQTACDAARSLTSRRVVGWLDGLRHQFNGHEQHPEVKTFLASHADLHEMASSSPSEPTWPI